MMTKAEKIFELSKKINKRERIKELKIECGKKSTQICVLTLRIKELESAATTNSVVVEALNVRLAELAAEVSNLRKKLSKFTPFID